MPTGYTATLCEQEQSFGEFALGCARAFGACVEQRDDPSSDLPKAVERDTWHEDKLVVAEAELNALLSMSEEGKITLGTSLQKERVEMYEYELIKGREVHRRLSHMIEKVHTWQPPTGEHVGLKEFMIEQLETTIRHDGNTDYYERGLASALAKTPQDYFNEKIQSAEWLIEYHKKEMAKSDARVVNQNTWISELYKSLSEVDPELTHLLLKKT